MSVSTTPINPTVISMNNISLNFKQTSNGMSVRNLGKSLWCEMRRQHRRERSYTSCSVSSPSHSKRDRSKLYKVHSDANKSVRLDCKRGHRETKRKSRRNKLTPCGCPNSCEAEISEIRNHIKKHLDSCHSDDDIFTTPIKPLSTLIDSRHDLLLEAWRALGSPGLRDLVSLDLLELCARREERDIRKKRCHITDDPPFSSLSGKSPSCGLRELWHRSLLELNELSTDQLKGLLSGAISPKSLPPLEMKTSKDAIEEADNSHELEVRKRAIRSLEAAKMKRKVK